MPRTGTEWIAAAFVAVAAASIAWEMIRSAVEIIMSHWYFPVGLVAIAGVIGVAGWRWKTASALRRASRLRHLRLTLHEIDAMSPTEFEHAVRDLMMRDGVMAEHVGQRGDKAADVIGRDTGGYVIVAQCKHTTVGGKAGSRVVYEVNGTAGPAHGADIAMIVTNGLFTRDARAVAADFRIHLLSRDELSRWGGEGTTLQQLLGLGTPLRRWRRVRYSSERFMNRARRVRGARAS
ncbi:restriction endonuclease [Nonomuraea sp. NPDC003804]|uniref:restriction endonuclease n=1 Tax=Nonomuraea sp. NPDC003804 TaxID=3154547 RepID=UPI00339DC410